MHKISSLELRRDVRSLDWLQGQKAASCLKVPWALQCKLAAENHVLLDLCAMQHSGCASGD